MVLRGHIENGAVVVDQPAELPEGAVVRIELLTDDKGPPPARSTIGEELLELAGRVVDLPEDAPLQHDDYLYASTSGVPYRSTRAMWRANVR